MTQKLPPITGDKVIDYFNELMVSSLEGWVDNVQFMTYRYLVISGRLDRVEEWAARHGMTALQAARSAEWARKLTFIVATASPPEVLDYLQSFSDTEWNGCVERLKQRLYAFVPSGWTPTPREPEGPGPGDITNLLKPKQGPALAVQQGAQQLLQIAAAPVFDAGAALSTLRLIQTALEPSASLPWTGPASPPGGGWLDMPRSALAGGKPRSYLFAAGGLDMQQINPDPPWLNGQQDGGHRDIIWCLQYAFGNGSNPTPIVQDWTTAQLSTAATVGDPQGTRQDWKVPVWTPAQKLEACRNTLSYVGVQKALADEPRYIRALAMLRQVSAA